MLHRSESAELKQLPGCKIWVPIAKKDLVNTVAIMPTSSPSLRKEVVSEDRKDMGCMTGILHIFDRRPSFSGRHCGCRWTATRNGLFSCHPQTDQMQVLFWICKGNETCKSWRRKKSPSVFFFLLTRANCDYSFWKGIP